MRKTVMLVSALLLAAVAGPPARASHPPLIVEYTAPAGDDHYLFVRVYDPFSNLEVLGDWALGCLGYGYGGYDCPSPPLGGDRVEVWEETNDVAGLQRSETCADGSTPSAGACVNGQKPVSPDTLRYSIY